MKQMSKKNKSILIGNPPILRAKQLSKKEMDNKISSLILKNSLTDNEYSIEFIGEIIAVAQLVVLGFNIFGKPKDPIPTTINNVLNGINLLSGRLNELNLQLNGIISQIEKLEANLKGYINEQMIRQQLGKVNGVCMVLSPYLTNEATARANLNSIISQRDQLAIEIVTLLSITDGLFTSAFLLAPAMSLWSQAFLVSWRLREPDYKNTLWDQPTFMQNNSIFLRLFAEHNKLKPNYEKALQTYPGEYNIVYEKVTDNAGKIIGFKKSNIEFQKIYGTIVNPTIFANTSTYYGGLDYFCSLIYNNLPKPGFRWRPIALVPENQFPDPTTIKDAKLKKVELDDEKNKIENYFKLMSKAENMELEFKKSILKPVSWGGVTPDEVIVVLINDKWEKVDVEVRRGNEVDCSNNAAYETKNLNFSESWPISASAVDICYRREKNPGGSPGVWNNWVKISTTQSISINLV